MGRFSRAEAEARGWTFVHSSEESTVITSETQGETRYTPPSLRAEKYVSLPNRGTTLVNEEGETEGKLLERIASYEAQHQSFLDGPEGSEHVSAATDEGAFHAPADSFSEADPTPVQNVILPGGETVTEAEWDSRSVNEARFDGEKMVYYGPSETVREAELAREERSAYVENLRTAEPSPKTKQITYDTADRIDSPGQSAGGTLIVPADTPDEVAHPQDQAARREQASQERENARVTAAQIHGRAVAPEGQDDLAGVDVSIQQRGDLGSEVPLADHTFDAAHTPVEDTEVSSESAADVRSEAIEEKAKEIRDDKGRAAADETEARADAVQAGADAEQKLADDAQKDDGEESPSETDSQHVELAPGEHVDVSADNE